MRRSLLALLLTGCGASSASVATTPTLHLVDVAWLTLGPWQSDADADGCFSVETWQRVDDLHLGGQSIAVCSADDSVARVTEEIVLEERPDGIFYVASPVGQERTEFQLTEGDAAHFVVENPTHDFPRRIAYRMIDETHVQAVVSGGERSFTLHMTRAADDPDPD
jgi:hypothetical protein